MKTLIASLSFLGIATIASLASAPASAAPANNCKRVVLPNSAVYEAVTICKKSTLPAFFQLIHWQRIENQNINGDDGLIEDQPKQHYCNYEYNRE